MSNRTDNPQDGANASSLGALIDIRHVDINQLSDVRHLHVSAFRAQAGESCTEAELEAFATYVYSTAYMDRIVAAACYGGWIDQQLVGTCSWAPASDYGPIARISDLFVSPLFARIGIGATLAQHTERRARDAGFTEFSVRVGVHAAPVFERLGYARTSHGVQQLNDETSIAVVFLKKEAADS